MNFVPGLYDQNYIIYICPIADQFIPDILTSLWRYHDATH